MARKLPPFLLTAIGIIILGACGGGNDRADTVDVSTPTATAKTGSTTTVPGTIAAPSATAEQEVDAGVLSKVVLTLEDMPAGWIVSPPSADGEDSDDFCGAEAKLQPKNLADAEFKQSDFGPFVAQRASLFSVGDAKKAMDSIRDTFKSCGATWTSSDTPPMTWTISALSFPKIGDETFAVRLSTTGVPLFGVAQVDVLYFRKGPVTEVLGYIALGPATATASPLEPMAKKVEEKLAKAGIR